MNKEHYSKKTAVVEPKNKNLCMDYIYGREGEEYYTDSDSCFLQHVGTFSNARHSINPSFAYLGVTKLEELKAKLRDYGFLHKVEKNQTENGFQNLL